ncbi:MAG: hypothetical protein ACYS30_25260 [Planctomycetota bacterium]|jgi:hypothetical protein
METKHTPGPWVAELHEDCGGLLAKHMAILTSQKNNAGRRDHIATVYAAAKNSEAEFRAEQLGNAEFIVRACNSHEKLLEACRALLEIVEPLVVEDGWGHTAEPVRKARAAIAEAEKGE